MRYVFALLLLATVAIWWASWLPAALAHDPPETPAVYTELIWTDPCPTKRTRPYHPYGCFVCEWPPNPAAPLLELTDCERVDFTHDGKVDMQDFIVMSKSGVTFELQMLLGKYWNKVCSEVDTEPEPEPQQELD